MTALKRRIVDHEDGRYWALYGPHGVISWGLLSPWFEGGEATHGPIGIHSPRPQWDDHEPSTLCPFLEGDCYLHSVYIPGDDLGRAWGASGRDDEVIWRELESSYHPRLASEARRGQ